MKSATFHEKRHFSYEKHCTFSWKSAGFMRGFMRFCRISCEKCCGFHEKCHISWKSTTFHEKQCFSCEIRRIFERPIARNGNAFVLHSCHLPCFTPHWCFDIDKLLPRTIKVSFPVIMSHWYRPAIILNWIYLLVNAKTKCPSRRWFWNGYKTIFEVTLQWFVIFIGLSYERPYLVLALNLILFFIYAVRIPQ